MDTKQAHSYLSKNQAYIKSQHCKIKSSRKFITLLRECKIRAKNQHSQQQQQQQQHHLLYSNNKDLQQFPWYLNQNTMFSYPRRRKFYQKRAHQVQNSMKIFCEMLHFTDNITEMNLNAMNIDSFLLKSSIAMEIW